MRRMDRYKEENTNSLSRMDKNQELYQNVSTNAVYTNISDVINANAYEINNQDAIDSTHTTREAYQQIQKYQNLEPKPREKRELEEFNHFYPKKENKIYDINSVLEEARKNRQEKDEKDDKRKLKNNAYNILAGINKEELEKYREEKKKRMLTPEEEGIRELIDTIASKTLAGELDKATTVDLLSDIMATSMLDKVSASADIKEDDTKGLEKQEEEETKTQEIEKEKEEEKTQEIEKEEEKTQTQEITKEKENTEEMQQDTEFYTRSMDLSDKDFEMSDEFKEASLPLVVKILIFLVIVALIAVAAYFIYQKII